MFKKIVVAIALAGCLSVLAPQGASAKTGTPVASVVEGGKDASGVVDRINARVASDKEYSDQLAAAIAAGDTKVLADGFAAEGASETAGQYRAGGYMIVCRGNVCDIYIYDCSSGVCRTYHYRYTIEL